MAEGEAPVFEDDGTTVEITVEGDMEGIELARRRIGAIVDERVCWFLQRYVVIEC